MAPEGYLIVQTFERRYAEYDRPARPWNPVYGIPISNRPATSSLKRYHGVDRRPLSAVPRQLRGEFREALVEPEAQDRLNRLEERGLAKDDLIHDLESARWVMSALKKLDSYELIGVSRAHERATVDTSGALGIDVAYIDGDHYSAIANCMFFPSWSGTDEAGTQYATTFEHLNENGLFSSINEAREFREVYERTLGKSDSSLEYLIVTLPAA